MDYGKKRSTQSVTLLGEIDLEIVVIDAYLQVSIIGAAAVYLATDTQISPFCTVIYPLSLSRLKNVITDMMNLSLSHGSSGSFGKSPTKKGLSNSPQDVAASRNLMVNKETRSIMASRNQQRDTVKARMLEEQKNFRKKRFQNKMNKTKEAIIKTQRSPFLVDLLAEVRRNEWRSGRGAKRGRFTSAT